jgi:acyl-CoA thioester hydrolase
MSYSKVFEVRWADLDPNMHMRHSAYNDYAAQVRFAGLTHAGFSLERFHLLKIGPVLFRETTDFLREVRAGDTITVNMLLAGASADGRKWKVRHEIFKADGQKSAQVTVDGAWFHLGERKVVAAPQELQEALNSFPKTGDFQVIP